jgi:hypothetical protein
MAQINGKIIEGIKMLVLLDVAQHCIPPLPHESLRVVYNRVISKHK